MNPTYLSILRQVAALGEATCRSLGDVPKMSKTMNNMAQYGWLLTVGFADSEMRGKGRPMIRIYRLTEAGRAALASGVVSDGVATRLTTNFNNRNLAHGKPKVVVDACVHAYDVGPPPRQHHRCTKCEKEFDVPMRFGLELVKVRPSALGERDECERSR